MVFSNVTCGIHQNACLILPTILQATDAAEASRWSKTLTMAFITAICNLGFTTAVLELSFLRKLSSFPVSSPLQQSQGFFPFILPLDSTILSTPYVTVSDQVNKDAWYLSFSWKIGCKDTAHFWWSNWHFQHQKYRSKQICCPDKTGKNCWSGWALPSNPSVTSGMLEPRPSCSVSLANRTWANLNATGKGDETSVSIEALEFPMANDSLASTKRHTESKDLAHSELR